MTASTPALRPTPLAALVALVGACGGADAPPPNLLLLSVDTLRADALGVYDPARRASPQLDAFAAGAAVFEAAYAPAPTTAPSHMTMFTGTPPRVHGVANLNVGGGRAAPETLPTLPELLRDAGLATAAFTGGANVTAGLGFARGFDVFEERRGETLVEKTAQALRWLDGLPQSARWFVFLHTYEVHSPYRPEARFRRQFFTPRTDADGQPLSLRQLYERGEQLDPDALAACRELYQAGVAQLDEAFGALLQQLDAGGHTQHALVVVTSDHGEQFGEHGGIQHRDLWRELLHIPLIVRLPERPGGGARAAGRRFPARVRQADLLPSLLELLGVEPARSTAFTGASWAGWLGDGAAAPETDRTAIGELRFWDPDDEVRYTVRWGDALLYRSATEERLFDLARDPGETRDLGAQRPADVQRLRARWSEWSAAMRALARRHAGEARVELTPRQRSQLEHLGYLGDD